MTPTTANRIKAATPKKAAEGAEPMAKVASECKPMELQRLLVDNEASLQTKGSELKDFD